MTSKQDYFKVRAISNHAISQFINGSPKEFKLHMEGKLDQDDTKDMKFGRILHKYLLEPEEFDSCYFLQEGGDGMGMMDKFIILCAGQEEMDLEKAYNEVGFKWKFDQVIKEFQKEENKSKYNRLIENTGKEPYSEDQLNSCKYILEAVNYHKTAYRLLFTGPDITSFREPEVFWTNSRGQDCKAKMDIINIDPYNRTIELCELKKTAFHPKKFESTIKWRGYHRQISWYIREALPQFLKQNDLEECLDYNVLNRFIVCQDHYPNLIRVIQLDDVDLTAGQVEYETALDAIQWHTANNFWEKREYKDRSEWIDYINLFGTDSSEKYTSQE